MELDPRSVARLRRILGPGADVVQADMLRFRHPGAHHVVSNVPFGITTPLLRHLLDQRAWITAVLMLQGEVARKRAAVGGTTLLTAELVALVRVRTGRTRSRGLGRRSTRQPPVLRRPDRPLLDDAQRAAYQRLVRLAFSGDRLLPTLRGLPGARRWAPSARPRDLTAHQWVALLGAATPPWPSRSCRGRARSR